MRPFLGPMPAGRTVPISAARTSTRGRMSIAALHLPSACSLGLILPGSFETVFVIMSALGAVPILAGELSLFKLRRDRPELARPWRALGYPWLPLLAVVLDIAVLGGF